VNNLLDGKIAHVVMLGHLVCLSPCLFDPSTHALVHTHILDHPLLFMDHAPGGEFKKRKHA